MKAELVYERKSAILEIVSFLRAKSFVLPVCIVASHIAFGLIRMEPVFFALGNVVGTAASHAIDAGCAVQDVQYEKLSARLVADGQVISWK